MDGQGPETILGGKGQKVLVEHGLAKLPLVDTGFLVVALYLFGNTIEIQKCIYQATQQGVLGFVFDNLDVLAPGVVLELLTQRKDHVALCRFLSRPR